MRSSGDAGNRRSGSADKETEPLQYNEINNKRELKGETLWYYIMEVTLEILKY